MNCEIQEQLLVGLNEAVRKHAETVNHLADMTLTLHSAEAFIQARSEVRAALAAILEKRRGLNKHCQDHGCYQQG